MEEPSIPETLLNEQTMLNAERCNITWRDAERIEMAYITALEGSILSVPLNNRAARHIEIRCDHAMLAGGALLREVALETLKIEEYAPTIVLELSDQKDEYEAFETKNVWKELQLRLQKFANL